MDEFTPFRWDGNALHLIDQLALPAKEEWLCCDTVDAVASAIRGMNVRGAPAIGCCAAYGVVIGAQAATATGTELMQALAPVFEQLENTRPTAVNLFWALDEMKRVLSANRDAPDVIRKLEARAIEMHREDFEMCRSIGDHGQALIPEKATVLTHCNAGALATGGYGTALGVIRSARAAGKDIRVVADETRPYLQGARLTAWELQREDFDVTVIPDSAAAFLMRQGDISCVVVGADRIAKNGDVANKIGTYSVALAAQAANVPFYVAAPRSTLDMECPSGDAIPIEERGGEEMTTIGTSRIAPEGVAARYPAFDVTPAALVTAIITDVGVAKAPYEKSLSALLAKNKQTA